MRGSSMSCFLGNPIAYSALTSGISEIAVRDLENIITVSKAGAGRTVFRQGEPAKWLYVLMSGNAVLRIAAGRRTAFKRAVMPGEVLGLPESAAGSDYMTSLKTQTECRFGRADSSEFSRLIRIYPALCLNVVSVLGLSIQKGYELFGSTSF